MGQIISGRCSGSGSGGGIDGGSGGGGSHGRGGGGDELEKSTKRRKIAASTAMEFEITGLSDHILVAIAQYLAKTEQALFAVALTAPPHTFIRRHKLDYTPNSPCKEIIASAGRPVELAYSFIESLYTRSHYGYLNKVGALTLALDGYDVTSWRFRSYDSPSRQKDMQCRNNLERELKKYYKSDGWSVLNFIDLDTSLVSKLTDVDIWAILVLIGAKKRLRMLKLTHCTGVAGWGLEPLCSGNKLESLDLRLRPSWTGCDVREWKGDGEDPERRQGTVVDMIKDILESRDAPDQPLQVIVGQDWMMSEGRLPLRERTSQNSRSLSPNSRSNQLMVLGKQAHFPNSHLEHLLDLGNPHVLRYLGPSFICCYFELPCSREEFARKFYSIKPFDNESEEWCGRCYPMTWQRPFHPKFVFCNVCHQMVCNRRAASLGQGNDSCGSILVCEGTCGGKTCLRCAQAYDILDPASKEVCVLFKLYRHPPSMSCGKCVSRAPGDWGA